MREKTNKPMHIFIFPLVPKNCPICKRNNPLSAKCCAYCGNPFSSPDLLHGKRGDSNHPKSDRTKSSLHFYITSLLRV